MFIESVFTAPPLFPAVYVMFKQSDFFKQTIERLDVEIIVNHFTIAHM